LFKRGLEIGLESFTFFFLFLNYYYYYYYYYYYLEFKNVNPSFENWTSTWTQNQPTHISTSFLWNVIITIKTPYRNSWFNRMSFFPMFFLPCLLSSCHIIVSNTRKLDSDWNKFCIAKFEIIFILFNGVFFIVEISSKFWNQKCNNIEIKWTFGFSIWKI
jgi:hypothetical protein